MLLVEPPPSTVGQEEHVLLADRVAFVTGAGSGIGREIAEVFAREGARIAAFDRSQETGEELVAALEAAGAREPLFVHGDVRAPADVERAMESVVASAGRVDILVNCAGVREIGDVYTLPADEWENVIAINLSGTHLHILQDYRKPRRETHPVFDADGNVSDQEGRLRLCPYFFIIEGEVRLGGALATFCPPDKKIIHGMQDAAMLPCRVTD